MSNPANVDDVEDRWRPLTDQEKVTATVRLADAWAEVTSRVPAVESRITSGSLSVDLVVKVVCDMVLRVMRNPEGYHQGSRTIDDFTESWTYGDSGSAGGVYATDDEIALLMPHSAGRAAGAFTIRQSPPVRPFDGVCW